LNTQEIGKAGEDYAAFWLSFTQLQILERNWRFGRNEIDIIAKDGMRLVFIEVKSRSSEKFDFPEDAVNRAKQTAILKVAVNYCNKVEHEGPVRFDIISVLFSHSGKKLIHTKDAFYPMGDTY